MLYFALFFIIDDCVINYVLTCLVIFVTFLIFFFGFSFL